MWIPQNPSNCAGCPFVSQATGGRKAAKKKKKKKKKCCGVSLRVGRGARFVAAQAARTHTAGGARRGRRRQRCARGGVPRRWCWRWRSSPPPLRRTRYAARPAAALRCAAERYAARCSATRRGERMSALTGPPSPPTRVPRFPRSRPAPSVPCDAICDSKVDSDEPYGAPSREGKVHISFCQS